VAILRTILDLARWAPSGDNTQPWRFEIVSASHLVVHGFDTRDHCVYDLDGHSSQLALGALLESIRIAASGHGLAATVARRLDVPESKPAFDVRFQPSDSPRSPLINYLPVRCVNRRPLRTRALTGKEKSALEASVGPGYRVFWIEGLSGRWQAARLMWRNARLRLTIPEAYQVHRSIIEWNARFSEDRIPEQALGASWLTARLMRFAMKSWSRIEFMNKWLGGTVVPRIELDLLPSLACGAHFLIASPRPSRQIGDYVEAGAAMQRFWLTATTLGLQVQPEMTPLIFARYVRDGRRFSTMKHAEVLSKEIAGALERVFGPELSARGVFMGRIGEGDAANARSLRLPLDALLTSKAS
jgi:nitroreductase